MTDSAERVKNLIEALEAAADGRRLEDFVSVGGADAVGRLEQAAARLFVKVRNINAESGQAMSNLVNANVRLLLWSEALQKINAADSQFHHGGTLDDFYHTIVVDAMQMTRARYGALGLFDEQGNLVRFLTEGVDAETSARIGHLPEGRGLLTALMHEHKPVRVSDIAADPRSCGFPPGHPPMRTLIGAPLVVGDRVKGVIYLTDKEGGELFGTEKEVFAEKFTEEDEGMLGLFTDYLVRSLERTELVIALQKSNNDIEEKRADLQKMVVKLNDAQNQLLQSEKMASIGQLAAGVAHEINNPIGFINSNLGSLTRYLGDMFAIIDAYEQMETESERKGTSYEKIRELKKKLGLAFLREDVPALLNESQDGLARVKKIINDLKDFSHVDESMWQWANLHKGLDSTLNVVKNEIKYKAEVVKQYGELPEVECLPSQLNQVFLNLLMNAVQAIAERGTITISTGSEGGTVWVAIADTGQGISPENLGRIFDPFFTTKPIGKGTGLGLSLSYSIVKKHGGRIEVTSKVGVGTTFRIILPVKHPKDEAAVT
jgi:signal transduction histidine kinase